MQKPLERISGVIPIGFPLRTFADRTMLVGDAAGQAKPLSGGGLYTGMTAARIAAEVALAALKEGDLSAERLSRVSEQVEGRVRKGAGARLSDPQGVLEIERQEARCARQDAGPTGGKGGPGDRGHRFPQPSGTADNQGGAQRSSGSLRRCCDRCSRARR